MPKGQTDESLDAVGRTARTLGQIKKTGAAFLVTDLNVAMTLTRIAGNAAEDSEKRHRNQASARRAYHTVFRFCDYGFLSAEDREIVGKKLAELRSALERLGEVFA